VLEGKLIAGLSTVAKVYRNKMSLQSGHAFVLFEKIFYLAKKIGNLLT
jgi:hypothetical protein